MLTSREPTGNNWGSKIFFRRLNPEPEKRILPFNQSYRLLNLNDLEYGSWVVTVDSRFEANFNVGSPTVVIDGIVEWGSGGVMHRAELSCLPGTIISVAGNTIHVDVTARAIGAVAGDNRMLQVQAS